MSFRRTACLVVAISFVGFLTCATYADDKAPGGIIFILDCSKSMGAKAASGSAVKEVAATSESVTRFDVARRTMLKTLDTLAADERHQVGVWLYGHRLAWGEGDNPEMLQQEKYLDATLGYGALSNLLPGDDVERLQPLKSFKADDLSAVKEKLDTLQPWGEKPLFLSLVRVIDEFANRNIAGPRSIVVLTDGGNKQWLARFKQTKKDVAAALEQRNIPIHVIDCGPATKEQEHTIADLKDFAEQSAGHLERATEDTFALAIDKILTANDPAAAPVEPAATVTATDQPEATAAAPAKLPVAPQPVERVVEGSIAYYSKKVQRATIQLVGSDLPPVKADREGRFIFKKVPPGKYQVKVEAVAENTAREATLDITVEPAGKRQAPLVIQVR